MLVRERARQGLANEHLLGLEMGIECPVGQAGLAHDSGDPGARDAVSAEALRCHIEDVPPCGRLVTFLETHRSFPFPGYWRT